MYWLRTQSHLLIELRMTNTCINNFFVSVSFKSQLFRLRHALSTILSGITTSTVASRFFLVLFYLNSATCEIPFLLSFSSSSLFRLYATHAKQSHYNESLQLPPWQETTLMLTILFFALLLFHIFLRASLHTHIYMCVIDHSLDFVSSHRRSRSLAVSK